MLKLIISKPCFFGGLEVSKYQDLIEQYVKEGHLICDAFYFHGKVEDKMGYDKGLCLNMEEIVKDNQIQTGIFDCELVDYPNPLKWYIYKDEVTGLTKGYIIDITDKESLNFAEQLID